VEHRDDAKDLDPILAREAKVVAQEDPGNSIETPSRTKIPITAQTTPSRPDTPPIIARRSI